MTDATDRTPPERRIRTGDPAKFWQDMRLLIFQTCIVPFAIVAVLFVIGLAIIAAYVRSLG